MNIVTSTPRRPGERTYKHVSVLFKAFCAALVLMVGMPVNAADTGISGTALWGPVQPGPARLGRRDEAPLRATFLVFAAEREVARFESDKKGNFEVLLPSGNYTIVPDKSTPVPGPQSQTKTVTVPKDGFAVVTLRFDTGMR